MAAASTTPVHPHAAGPAGAAVPPAERAALGAHWRLVGPWYRWPRPGHPEDGREAAPSIQMFAGNDFMARFLARPQHSLRYDEVVDVVQAHDLVPAGLRPGKLATLFALDAQGQPLAKDSQDGTQAYRARLAPGQLRKLYQPIHDRHYLVCCELHCDEPGFPRVTRQRVCQAGFVLRRRRSVLPAGLTAADLETRNAPVRRAEADLYEHLILQASADDTALDSALRQAARQRMQQLASSAGKTDWAALLLHLRTQLAQQRAALQQWQQAQGVAVRLEGWFPSGQPQRGEWRELPDAAAQSADVADSGEQAYPLHSLVPDPREPQHDAAGRTFFYGVIPTQDLQHDAQGRPHLDDTATYELRCFVRAHHACAGRAGRQPDCHGPLRWSRPTEAFRVAAPFDVLGSANRPVTIRMPDLRDLAAQAAQRPRGRLSPIHFHQPQHLSPKELGGEAICSFSIPLITIVALFVLNLFLPVVVFLFQLWFLLVFRFCIPPQIKLAMDADAALAATPPGVDFSADFAVRVNGTAQTAAQLEALLKTGSATNPNNLADRLVEDTGSEDSADLSSLDNNALASLNQNLSDAMALKPDAQGREPPLPDTGTPLVYEPAVTPVWTPRGGSA